LTPPLEKPDYTLHPVDDAADCLEPSRSEQAHLFSCFCFLLAAAEITWNGM